MCPRDNNFVEVDEKIYWVQDEIHPLLSHSTPKILCVVLISVYILAKKNLSHFDIGIHMLLFIQYIKENFLIYKHHCRFQKTGIEN